MGLIGAVSFCQINRKPAAPRRTPVRKEGVSLKLPWRALARPPAHHPTRLVQALRPHQAREAYAVPAHVTARPASNPLTVRQCDGVTANRGHAS